MANRLSPSVVARIEDALTEPGITRDTEFYKRLATNLNVSLRSIYNHKRRIGANVPVGARSGGPKPIITWEMKQSIKLLLDQQPWLYQDEIRDFLWDAWDRDIRRQTVSQILKGLEITRKKLKVEAAQRNQELRTDWQNRLQGFEACQIVCVDESGSDGRTGDRMEGWASKGARAKVSRWLANRTRVSVLPAYSIEGYIASTTFEGTCTGDIFADFMLDQLLPICNPYPLSRSVVILDNASVHHASKAVKRAFRRKGVLLRFLPPYSPDFNPIEESFGDLKAYIRRTYRQERDRFDTYQDYLEWAVRKSGTGHLAMQRARGHFRNAGIQ